MEHLTTVLHPLLSAKQSKTQSTHNFRANYYVELVGGWTPDELILFVTQNHASRTHIPLLYHLEDSSQSGNRVSIA